MLCVFLLIPTQVPCLPPFHLYFKGSLQPLFLLFMMGTPFLIPSLCGKRPVSKLLLSPYITFPHSLSPSPPTYTHAHTHTSDIGGIPPPYAWRSRCLIVPNPISISNVEFCLFYRAPKIFPGIDQAQDSKAMSQAAYTHACGEVEGHFN